VLTKAGIDYNSSLSSITLSIKALGADVNSTVATFTELIELADYCSTVLSSTSTESFITSDLDHGKRILRELVGFVCASYERVGRTPPSSFKALAKEEE
jgi:hypothetical protein